MGDEDRRGLGAQGAANGGDRHQEHNEEAGRFRGEMDGERTDGGWLPPEKERNHPDDPSQGGQGRSPRADGPQDVGGGAAELGRGAPPAGAGAADGRSRWSQGVEQGAGFSRDRDWGSDRHMEYGDAQYNQSSRYGMQSGARWPDEQRTEAVIMNDRFSGDEHQQYRAWRAEQIRLMDEDYEEFMKHRRQDAEFGTHFATWRRSKYGDFDHGSYVGQNTHIGATPVEFGGQNATNSGFSTEEEK
jgi:hypothetical protein